MFAEFPNHLLCVCVCSIMEWDELDNYVDGDIAKPNKISDFRYQQLLLLEVRALGSQCRNGCS